MDNTLPMNAETKDKAGVYLTELAGRMLPRFEEENNKKMTTIADPRTKSRGRTDSKTREKYTRNEFEALLEMFLGGPMSEGVLTGPINLDGLISDINQAYNITCLLVRTQFVVVLV
ncbi:hypothetical protein niasHS_018052 [Heterodera schachtii]|uniref:Uncharacterized protein n=1 Tax=Heterodera schachtii TaxID=97005 RepID=A0ABD2HSB0_HETSC